MTGVRATAWRVRAHGEPAEVLVLEHAVALPEPGPHEVVLAVDACALNFADRLLCTGQYQEHPPLPFTPGLEVTGVVVATGPEAQLTIGHRVLGSPALPHGALATHCLAADHDVFPIPDALPPTTAAAMHIAYQTGWFALHRRGGIRRGDTLLVHAGAGGVGSAAIQLGKAAGATVIATAGGPDKVARCRASGADLALDHRVDDVVAAVLDATDRRGADLIFDPVGGDTFVLSTRCVAWEGRILVIGAAGGRYAEARTNHLLVKNYSVVGVHWGGYRSREPALIRAAHLALVDLWTAGMIDPPIGEVLPLLGVPDALGRLTSGTTSGKLVVDPRA